MKEAVQDREGIVSGNGHVTETPTNGIFKASAPGGNGNGSGGGSGPWAAQSQQSPGVDRRTLLSVMGSVLLGMLAGGTRPDHRRPGDAPDHRRPQRLRPLFWVVTIYLLTSTITVPIFGKLSDMYGRKWLYMGGIGVFLIGSVLSGLSADINQLIAFRGIQGLGAGIIFASAFAIIADLIPPANRGKWQGAFGARVGPVLGDRPHRGRLPHRQPQLALGLLREHTDRPGGAGGAVVIFPRETRSPHNKVHRLAGRGHAHRRA